MSVTFSGSEQSDMSSCHTGVDRPLVQRQCIRIGSYGELDHSRAVSVDWLCNCPRPYNPRFVPYVYRPIPINESGLKSCEGIIRVATNKFDLESHLVV